MLLRTLMKPRASYEEPESEAAKCSSAINNLFIHTCASILLLHTVTTVKIAHQVVRLPLIKVADAACAAFFPPHEAKGR